MVMINGHQEKKYSVFKVKSRWFFKHFSNILSVRYYSQPYLISIHDIGCSFSKK